MNRWPHVLLAQEQGRQWGLLLFLRLSLICAAGIPDQFTGHDHLRQVSHPHTGSHQHQSLNPPHSQLLASGNVRNGQSSPSGAGDPWPAPFLLCNSRILLCKLRIIMPTSKALLMWNKCRFSFHFWIYLYATGRWTFLKHLFCQTCFSKAPIAFLLKNITAPRCDVEERRQNVQTWHSFCRMPLYLPTPLFLGLWNSGCLNPCPSEKRACIGLPRSPLGAGAPYTATFFLWSFLRHQTPDARGGMRWGLDVSLRRNTPQCLDDKANISWIFVPIPLWDEII